MYCFFIHRCFSSLLFYNVHVLLKILFTVLCINFTLLLSCASTVFRKHDETLQFFMQPKLKCMLLFTIKLDSKNQAAVLICCFIEKIKIRNQFNGGFKNRTRAFFHCNHCMCTYPFKKIAPVLTVLVQAHN